jgi:uncharacterized protein
MATADLVVIAVSLLVAAIVQGLSGLGFALVAAPSMSLLIPGSQAIGLVNFLAFFQAIWQIWRETGAVQWSIMKRFVPALSVGVFVGFLGVRFLGNDIRPLIVAISSLASLGALLFWRPAGHKGTAIIAGIWGGSVTTYAGVGGPAIAAYLIKQGWSHADYIRTQMVVFAGLSLVSIPVLGLPPMIWWQIALAIVIVFLGSSIGIVARRRVPAGSARRLTEVVIFVVATYALIRSLMMLFAG